MRMAIPVMSQSRKTQDGRVGNALEASTPGQYSSYHLPDLYSVHDVTWQARAPRQHNGNVIIWHHPNSHVFP